MYFYLFTLVFLFFLVMKLAKRKFDILINIKNKKWITCAGMHQKVGGVYAMLTTSQKPSFVMSLDVLSHPRRCMWLGVVWFVAINIFFLLLPPPLENHVFIVFFFCFHHSTIFFLRLWDFLRFLFYRVIPIL